MRQGLKTVLYLPPDFVVDAVVSGKGHHVDAVLVPLSRKSEYMQSMLPVALLVVTENVIFYEDAKPSEAAESAETIDSLKACLARHCRFHHWLASNVVPALLTSALLADGEVTEDLEAGVVVFGSDAARVARAAADELSERGGELSQEAIALLGPEYLAEFERK